MRRVGRHALCAALLSASLAGGLATTASAGTVSTWHVKVTNLTTGQPFSPPLWAVHNNKVHIWQRGHQATNGAALIAEDALATPLAALLQTDPNVRSDGIATPGPILPGGTREFDVTARGPFSRISMMWMLVRTNDAFSGLDSVPISSNATSARSRKAHRKPKVRTLLVNAYDAGTEKNNENPAFIPGPPFGNFFVRDQDAQLITRHPGLNPAGPLGAYVWQDPVARIEITRVP